jgi:hypothetical protein
MTAAYLVRVHGDSQLVLLDEVPNRQQPFLQTSITIQRQRHRRRKEISGITLK